MSSLRKLLKSVDIENTNWEKFDWGDFEIYLKNYQETGAPDLSHDEVVKLNTIRGFWLVHGSQEERKRNLGALKSSYSSPNSLRKPAFWMPRLKKVEPQSRSGRTYYYSAVFRNAAVLRLLVKKFTKYLREHKRNLGEPSWVHSRIIDQMDSEAQLGTPKFL